jgi:hypothetical protein
MDLEIRLGVTEPGQESISGVPEWRLATLPFAGGETVERDRYAMGAD